MTRNKFLLMTFCLLFCSLLSKSQNDNDVEQYVSQFKQYAIEEQKRTGVPAAITLAQGIHETASGKSELATNANNHFGIKCKSNWEGDTYFYDDDKKQECFRKYNNALQSYIDHSDFLKQGSRYASLFSLEITDYVGWAQGLKKAGYATNPLYSKKLIELIEKFNLQQYTYEALKNNQGNVGEVIPNADTKKIEQNITDDPTQTYKGLKGFWAKKGDDIKQLAAQYDIKPAKLIEFNELQGDILPNDIFVFTQKKKRIGTVEFHNVQEGETMYLISQKEAMSLDNLYMFNNLKKGDEPMIGEQLSLQYKAYNTPKILPKSDQNIEKTAAETPPVATVEQSDIKDLEKAKKVESILTGKSVEKSEIILPTTIEPKNENTTTAVKEVVEEKKVEEKKVEPILPKEKPKAPKRTYNEPGVDKEVKEMKQRFDEMVYRPFERKAVPKKDTSKTQTIVTKTNTGATLQTIEKKTTKDTAQAKPTKTTSPNLDKNIQKTESGIKRDAKKIEEDKNKAAAEKRNISKQTPTQAAKKTGTTTVKPNEKKAAEKTVKKVEEKKPTGKSDNQKTPAKKK